MAGVIYRLPAGASADAVISELGGSVRLRTQPCTRLRRLHLDTFDWRLWRAGGELVFEHTHGAGRLLWSGTPATAPCVMPATRPPVRGGDLPQTLAGRRIASLIGPRVVLPLGASNGLRRAGAVLDSRDKVVVRLTVDESSVLDGDDRPVGSTETVLCLEGLVGFEAERDRVAELLASALGVEPSHDDRLQRAAAARGRAPGDYSSKLAIPLDPDDPTETAVRRILAALLETATVNAPHAGDDRDPEFLHDLRVAVRRARSVLGQLKRAVPPELRESLGGDLRWLGSLTGPARDLDVFTIEFEDLAVEAQITDPSALEPFRDLLQHRRKEARDALQEGLSGPRFGEVIRGWRAAVAEPFAVGAGPDSARPAAVVARERIRRALDRVIRRGTALGPASPLASFHVLRIDAKKLRYLLEVFAALLPDERAAAQVKALKRLQDVLGMLQDVSVQRARVRAFADELAARRPAPAATLLALGRMTVALDARESASRASFHDRFAGFADSDARTHWDELLSPGTPT